MLPFGSVLMHIPLLILAFAYLVYAGAATVNKLKPCDEQDHQASAKVQNITVTESKDDKTLFLHQYPDEKQAVVKTAIKPQLCKQLCILTVFIPDRKAPSFFFGSDIYSRPPPIMG